MQLHAEARFDADPAAVAQMLADEDFVRTAIAVAGAEPPEVKVDRLPDGSFTVTTRRRLPTDRVPAQLRSMIGAFVTVVQVEMWQGPDAQGRGGTVTAEVTGVPVRVDGTLRLAGSDSASSVVLDGDVRASVPLFGGPIERAVVDAVTAAVAAQQDAGRAWLARGASAD